MGALREPGREQDSVLVDDGAWFRLDDSSGVGAARRAAVELARRAGLGEPRAGEVAIAVTEAASNLVRHAQEGQLLLRRVPAQDGSSTVEMVAMDSGPGMSAVPVSAADGHSTTGTLGIGIGAIQRLSDACEIASLPDRGTVMVASFYAERGRRTSSRPFAGITRPMTGEQQCGDGYAARAGAERTTLLLCDGLGHGPMAARAAQEAVRAFRETETDDPAALLRRVHERLRGTRGAAAAVAVIDHASRTVRYAGVGNISGSLLHAEGRSGLVSHPGIVGHQARTIRESSYRLPSDGAVVLHSDGVTDRWSPAHYPGLERRDPLVVAAVVLRDAGVRRDDASILVGRVA